MKPEEKDIQSEEVEDPQTEIEQLSDHLREYVGMRRQLFELQLWNKLSGASASAITWGVIIFLAAISLFLLSAGLAWWIGLTLGRVYFGFLIVAGGLALLSILIYLGRDKFLEKPLADRFIENLLIEEEESENENDENSQQKAA